MMASFVRQLVVPTPVVCLASTSQPSVSSNSEPQPAKVRALGSSNRRLTNDVSSFSTVPSATKASQSSSVEEHSDLELSARVSRRDSLLFSGALLFSLVGLSSNEAQAQERSKEAEQAAQVQEDSGKVAERRKQAAAQQQDVVWGRKIPQISRNEKSTEAQQADQVKQDSALVSERRKAADSQQQQQQPQPQESIGSPGDFIQELAPPSLFNDEKAVWYEYPVADQQKSLEAQQADQVKQDSAKVAERRKKRKEEQRLSAVSFSL